MYVKDVSRSHRHKDFKQRKFYLPFFKCIPMYIFPLQWTLWYIFFYAFKFTTSEL